MVRKFLNPSKSVKFEKNEIVGDKKFKYEF
jgi:hypothetical protein